jgi:hypothetical protein
LQLRFIPTIGDRVLRLAADMVPANPAPDSTTVTMLRCYISGISLWRDGRPVWQEKNSYHLLDAEHSESMSLLLHVPQGLQYSSVHFNLGIDSATSSSGAHGGDLDPVKGMYWAWQSGYINFKLEGTSPVCPARRHAFQFHIGGYQYPFNAMQSISLPVKQAEQFVIKMDVGQFLSGIDLAKQYALMIPGAEALELSRKAAQIFHVLQ